ncbi:MAG: hypothetical protein MZV63_65160 [Marinilabiliales bacterium]|nr:hypothetical protein [Marinilabiliales bacterium]
MPALWRDQVESCSYRFPVEVDLEGRHEESPWPAADRGRGQAGTDDLGGHVEVVPQGPDDRILEGQGDVLRLLAEAGPPRREARATSAPTDPLSSS